MKKPKEIRKKREQGTAYCEMYFCPLDCLNLDRGYCITFGRFLKVRGKDKLLERVPSCIIYDFESIFALSNLSQTQINEALEYLDDLDENIIE